MPAQMITVLQTKFLESVDMNMMMAMIRTAYEEAQVYQTSISGVRIFLNSGWKYCLSQESVLEACVREVESSARWLSTIWDGSEVWSLHAYEVQVTNTITFIIMFLLLCFFSSLFSLFHILCVIPLFHSWFVSISVLFQCLSSHLFRPNVLHLHPTPCVLCHIVVYPHVSLSSLLALLAFLPYVLDWLVFWPCLFTWTMYRLLTDPWLLLFFYLFIYSFIFLP